jgi:DNA adenine methylase
MIEDYPLEREEPYLAEFLNSIRSSTGFKRVIESPLRYAGGKSKAVGLILDVLPKLKHKRIVSPFFGGGSFELCVSQSLGLEVIGYDIFEMLANFWDILINRRDEFVCELKKFEINETEFTRNRHILLAYWDKVKPTTLVYNTKQKIDLSDDEMTRLDDDKLLQAVYYYYNMTLSYGPMFLGWQSSNEIKKEKFERRIEKLSGRQLTKLKVSCCDFKTAILNHPDDFLFLDPPYYLGQDSKMFKGIYPNSNFAIHHNAFPHQALCELLKNHKGGFLMTYNNCETIRKMYADYKQTFPEWQYTYGQGETRIGKNRTNSNIKESHEIFIICPPLFTC